MMLTVFHYQCFYKVFFFQFGLGITFFVFLYILYIVFAKYGITSTHLPNELGDVRKVSPKLARRVNVPEKMGKLSKCAVNLR